MRWELKRGRLRRSLYSESEEVRADRPRLRPDLHLHRTRDQRPVDPRSAAARLGDAL